MIKIKEAILVEGAYDKIKLSSVADTLIIPANGFAVFNDKEKLAFLRSIAQKRGVIIFTDPDRAGFMIRNFIKQGLPPGSVKHAYIPDVYGKENRKKAPGKEGKLGVEGVHKNQIISALRGAGATILNEDNNISPEPMHQRRITKLDLYQDGFCGAHESSARRRRLAKHFGLPERISANMLIDALNTLITYNDYRRVADEL